MENIIPITVTVLMVVSLSLVTAVYDVAREIGVMKKEIQLHRTLIKDQIESGGKPPTTEYVKKK